MNIFRVNCQDRVVKIQFTLLPVFALLVLWKEGLRKVLAINLRHYFTVFQAETRTLLVCAQEILLMHYSSQCFHML